jgi:hypothetical protein
MIATTPEARAAAVLADLTERGFTLRASGPRLLVSPISRLSGDDRAVLQANRAELIRLLPDSRSGLEVAIDRTADELLGEANTLADFAANTAGEMGRAQQLALLHRLTGITLRLRRTSTWLCERDDEADERSGRQ